MKRLLFVAVLFMVATFLFQSYAQKQSITFSPTIPKTWVDKDGRTASPAGSVEDTRALIAFLKTR